jgi:ABC-type nitrate/sulfonate/bicarbonate transport system ATPase subunit
MIPEAIELSDRIAVMTGQPGSIEAIVPNTLPRPRNIRSKESFALEDKLLALVKPPASKRKEVTRAVVAADAPRTK